MKLPFVSNEIIIREKSKWTLFDLREVWRYRELFYIFAWRDIKVRYKQTVLGIAWALFQPFVSMIIFTVFFGTYAKIPTASALPYPLFVFSGLIFWTFFSNTLSGASNTLIENGNIIQKVYIPKVILPLSIVVTGFVDFCITLIMLLLLCIYFQFLPTLSIVWVLPVSILITALSASGLGLFLSAVNIKYRDVRYILPYFIQTLIFLTPVIYPSAILSPTHRVMYAVNPMVGVIESMRAVISGGSIDFVVLGISGLCAVVFFIGGLAYFNKTERFFADII